MGFMQSLLKGFTEYCKKSTFHGLPLIVANKRHILERIFWITMFFLAISGAVRLSLMNWERYIANPTVMSLQKDYRNWYNPFPAATGCFTVRVDEEKGQEYIKKKWNIEPENDKYEYYMNFLKTVANVSYYTMQNFTQFNNDKSLEDIDFLDVALKVHPEIEGDLVTFDAKRTILWDIISTEYGICFTTNSKTAQLFAADKFNNLSIYNSNNLLKCHYLNGMCYARFDSEPTIPVNYYIHSPFEIIHTTSVALYLPEKSEVEVNYQMQETSPSLSIRKLSITQRKCRFYDEADNKVIPAYSMGICNILCRYKNALKKCGCKPFFYNRLPGKICDISGMVCLAKYVDFFTRSAQDMGCNCVEPCRVITYTQQNIKSNFWVGGYFDQRVTLRWALMHPRTRYQRDVLFGFEDLVVSFGGTASLFFGMSFLSIVEVILFIVNKIFAYLCVGKKMKINKIDSDVQINVMDYKQFGEQRIIPYNKNKIVASKRRQENNFEQYTGFGYSKNYNTSIPLYN